MKRFFISLKEADIRNILAVMTTLACFALQVIIILKPIPPANHDIVIASLTYTLGGLSMCLGYYFGSSKGSGKKSENEKPEV